MRKDLIPEFIQSAYWTELMKPAVIEALRRNDTWYCEQELKQQHDAYSDMLYHRAVRSAFREILEIEGFLERE